MAQSVKRPTSAQVKISRFVGLSHASSSVLTAQSPEPASDSVSPSLSAPPRSCSHALFSLSLSLKNKHQKKLFFNKMESQFFKGPVTFPVPCYVHAIRLPFLFLEHTTFILLQGLLTGCPRSLAGFSSIRSFLAQTALPRRGLLWWLAKTITVTHHTSLG